MRRREQRSPRSTPSLTRRVGLHRLIGALVLHVPQRAEDHDKKMTDRWKADADGILVFVSRHSSIPYPFVPQPRDL